MIYFLNNPTDEAPWMEDPTADSVKHIESAKVGSSPTDKCTAHKPRTVYSQSQIEKKLLRQITQRQTLRQKNTQPDTQTTYRKIHGPQTTSSTVRTTHRAKERKQYSQTENSLAGRKTLSQTHGLQTTSCKVRTTHGLNRVNMWVGYS